MRTFLGTRDLGGEGKTVLLAVINSQLNKNYTLDTFAMSNPYAPVEANPTHNTCIDLAPSAGTGIYGARKFYYDRINLASFGPMKIYKPSVVASMHLFLSFINQSYGIELSVTDVVDSPIITTGINPFIGTVIALPNSVLFYGSTSLELHTTPFELAPTPPPPTMTVPSEWNTTGW